MATPRLFRRFRRSPQRQSSTGPGRTAGPGGIPPELLERVRAIEIKARRLVDNLFLGEYHAVFRGQGIEFDELRPYNPGDEVRSIDWKTLARTGKPFVRRYREDRDLTVVFLVDVSGSQFAGTSQQTKADLAAELCAVLAIAAIRNKDRVGLLLFASKPERYIRPAGDRLHVLRVVREVLWARPETDGTNIGAALEYLTSVQKKRATVFLLSDFLTTGYARALRAARRRHDIVAIRLREPIDERLPNAGLVRIADAETGAATYVDTGDRHVRDDYAARVKALDEDRRRTFGELSIDEIQVELGKDYVPAFLRFFQRRTGAGVRAG